MKSGLAFAWTMTITLSFMAASCRSNSDGNTKTIEFDEETRYSVVDANGLCSPEAIKASQPSLIAWLAGRSRDKNAEKIIRSYKSVMYQHILGLLYARLITSQYPQHGKDAFPALKLSQLQRYLPKSCRRFYSEASPPEIDFMDPGAINPFAQVEADYFDTENHVKRYFNVFEPEPNNACFQLQNGQDKDPEHLQFESTLKGNLDDLCENPDSIDLYLDNPIALSSLLKSDASGAGPADESVETVATQGFCAYTKWRATEESNYARMYRQEFLWTAPLGFITSSALFLGAIKIAIVGFIPTLGNSAYVVPAAGVASETAIFAATWGPRFLRQLDKESQIQRLIKMEDGRLPTGCNRERLQTEIKTIKKAMVGDWIGLFVGGAVAAFLPPAGAVVHTSFRQLFMSEIIKIAPAGLIEGAGSLTVGEAKAYANTIGEVGGAELLDPRRLYHYGQVASGYLQRAFVGAVGAYVGYGGWMAGYNEYKGLKKSVEELPPLKTEADVQIEIKGTGLQPIVITDAIKAIDTYSESFKSMLRNSENSEVAKRFLDIDTRQRLAQRSDSATSTMRRVYEDFIRGLLGEASLFGTLPERGDVVELTSLTTGQRYVGHAVETFSNGVHVVFLYEPTGDGKTVRLRVFPAGDIRPGSAKKLALKCAGPLFSPVPPAQRLNEKGLFDRLVPLYQEFDAKIENEVTGERPNPQYVRVTIEQKSYRGIVWQIKSNADAGGESIAYINFPTDAPPIDLDSGMNAAISVAEILRRSDLDITADAGDCNL